MDENVPLRSPLGVPYRSPLGALAKSVSFTPSPTTNTIECVISRQNFILSYTGAALNNQAITIHGTGPDLGHVSDGTQLTITGTGAYDGVYTAFNVRGDRGAWVFDGGDLDSIIYQGNAAGGQWQLERATEDASGLITRITRGGDGACDSGSPSYPFQANGGTIFTIAHLLRPLEKTDFPIDILRADGSVLVAISANSCLIDDFPNAYAFLDPGVLLLSLRTPGTSDPADVIVHVLEWGPAQETDRLPPTTGLLGLRYTLSNQGAPIAPWGRCFDYTVIAEGPSATYPALAQGTNFHPDSLLLRFSNIAPYDGDHTVEYLDANTVRLPNLNWTGNASGGDWINDDTQFNAASDPPSSPIAASIQNSTIAGYNGPHTFISDGPGVWIVEGFWFLGDATGEIVIPGAPGINIAGNPGLFPPGATGAINLRISGTTSYNGDYACSYARFGALVVFFGGDLASVPFVADEPGTWLDIDNPSNTDTIANIAAVNPPEIIPFSSVNAGRSGLVNVVRSSVMRITAAGHTALVGNDGRIFSDGAIYEDNYRAIRGVALDTVDIDGVFTATDTGRLAIR